MKCTFYVNIIYTFNIHNENYAQAYINQQVVKKYSIVVIQLIFNFLI